MARKKNALTKYEIAETTEPESFMLIGKWINEVEDTTEDKEEDFSDYAGDGNQYSDVTGVKEGYEFSGTFDSEDPAQKYIKSIRRKVGSGREVIFRITDPEGTTYKGLATVSNIVFRGGVAHEFPTFSCTITFNEEPEEVPTV